MAPGVTAKAIASVTPALEANRKAIDSPRRAEAGRRHSRTGDRRDSTTSIARIAASAAFGRDRLLAGLGAEAQRLRTSDVAVTTAGRADPNGLPQWFARYDNSRMGEPPVTLLLQCASCGQSVTLAYEPLRPG